MWQKKSFIWLRIEEKLINAGEEKSKTTDNEGAKEPERITAEPRTIRVADFEETSASKTVTTYPY